MSGLRAGLDVLQEIPKLKRINDGLLKPEDFERCCSHFKDTRGSARQVALSSTSKCSAHGPLCLFALGSPDRSE